MKRALQRKTKRILKRSPKWLKNLLLSILIFEISFGSLVVEVISQENRFRDLWRKGTDGRLERQFEQANQATSEAEFEKAVGRGLGTLRSDWEARADLELERELKKTSGGDKEEERRKLETEKSLAYSEWEGEVQAEIDARKGMWKAHIKSASLERVWEVMDRSSLVSGIQQADVLSRQGATATDKVRIWDETLNAISTSLQANWESTLDGYILEARSGVGFRSENERIAFEVELSRIREYYVSEYEYEESSLISAKRMYFVSQQNQNEEIANRIAQETDPSELARLLVERTKQKLRENGGVFVLGENQLPSQVSLNFQSGGDDYQKQVIKTLESGQEIWQRAIDEMVLGKLQYDRDVEMQWRSGEADWTKAYGELIKAREEWLGTVQRQIQEGLSRWEASESTMAANKAKAAEELERTLTSNRVKWESHVRGITDILTMGADTLATIASNKKWFQEALTRASAPNSGYSSSVISEYQQQLNYWSGLESRYRNLVAASQNQIHNEDIRGTGVGQGLLFNAGGSDPYVLTVEEFELKLSREELKILEAKRDRAKAVYDYAVGNVAGKTAAQVAAELDTIRANFKARETAYLTLLSELNGSGSSVFGTPGLDNNSSIETGSTVANGNTLLSQLEAANKRLEEKRKQLEIAKSNMDEALVGYESALKIQVLIQNPGMLGQIGDLTTDSSRIQGNSGLRGEIAAAQEEIERQREVLRQQERKMYELQYERENAFRSQTFYSEMNQRILEFEKLKENRLAINTILNSDVSLEDRIDTLLSGDTLVQLYGNQVSEQVRASLVSWKSSLTGLDTNVENSITAHDTGAEALRTKVNSMDLGVMDALIGSISQYENQYGNVIDKLYSDNRLDSNYLNLEAIGSSYEYLRYLSDNRGDALAAGREGMTLLSQLLGEYKTYVDANVSNRGSLEYASKITELEQGIGYAVSRIELFNQYVGEVNTTVQYLNVNVLDAISKADVLIDATLTGAERQAAKDRFKSLRSEENLATNTILNSLNTTGTSLSGLSQGLAGYGQSSVNFRNAIEGRNSTTKQVSDGLLSLYDGFELSYREKEFELKFLLDENGDEAKLSSIQQTAKTSWQVAGAEVNAKALELMLGYIKDLREGERDAESIYLRILRDSEEVNRDSKTDASSILNRRAMGILVNYFRSGRSGLNSYLEGDNYTNFVTEIERISDYANDVLAYYESGREFTQAEKETIRWGGNQEEKKLLAESYQYGSSFFFKDAVASVGREVEISRRVDIFAEKVKSGEVLSVLKEEYFRRQENKATGLLKELHDAVSGLDAVTASRLYNDSFVIGSAGDRDLGEETRRENLLNGYLAGATTTVEKLTAILSFEKLIEVFGSSEGVKIYNDILARLGAISSSADLLNISSSRLEGGFAAVENAYPDFLAHFSSANRLSYETEISKIDQFLELSNFEDTSESIYDETDPDNPIFMGYLKPFSNLDYTALEASKETLGEMILGWDRMQSELNDAYTEYSQALSDWRASSPGTSEYADLAAIVSQKLKVLSEKQAQTTDYFRELTLQIDDSSERQKALIGEMKTSLGLPPDKIFVTASSLSDIRAELPGLASVFDDSSTRDQFYYYPTDGDAGLKSSYMAILANKEFESILAKTKSTGKVDSLVSLNGFSEAMMFGSNMSGDYIDLYSKRDEAREQADDFLDSMDDSIVVYASQASMNQISQQDLVKYTRGIKEFLTLKSSRGEAINSSLWEALANVEAYTDELSGLRYYQSLSQADRADTAKLKTEYETSKSARESLERAGELYSNLKSLIEGLDSRGIPLDQSLVEIGSALGEFENLKTKLDAGGYTLDSRIENGFAQLKEYAWQNHKSILATAFVESARGEGTFDKFLSDVKSGKFVLPGPSGKIERNANFLGRALTDAELTELTDYLTQYDFQVRILKSQNLSQIDSLLTKYDEGLRESGRELALRESYNRIQQSLSSGMFPNPGQYPSELKNYILTSAFEAYFQANLGTEISALTNEFSLQMNLGEEDRSTILEYANQRESKNPSRYLPESLVEYHLLDNYYASWTGGMNPEDTTALTTWLNTRGYDSGMIGTLREAARIDLLVRSYSGEDINEYIDSANNRLTSPITNEEKEAIILSRAGLYDPRRPGGTDPFFKIQTETFLRSFTYQTGFSDLADALGEESKNITIANLRLGRMRRLRSMHGMYPIKL